jgi:hypothetical protein
MASPGDPGRSRPTTFFTVRVYQHRADFLGAERWHLRSTGMRLQSYKLYNFK